MSKDAGNIEAKLDKLYDYVVAVSKSAHENHDETGKRLDRIDGRLDRMENRLESVDHRLVKVEYNTKALRDDDFVRQREIDQLARRVDALESAIETKSGN